MTSFRCTQSLVDFGNIEGGGIKRPADPSLEVAMLEMVGISQRCDELFIARSTANILAEELLAEIEQR